MMTDSKSEIIYLYQLEQIQFPKMKRKHSKSIPKRNVSVAVTFLLFLFIFFAVFHSTKNLDFPAKTTPTVKIYMYELPSNTFTDGVIEHFFKARGRHVRPPWEYPSHQHSAEWHLFRDLLRPAGKRVGSHSIRVTNPEFADMFFVPFFSSLSAIVNKTMWFIPGTDKDLRDPDYNYSDEAVQEALMDWLMDQPYWRRNGGRDHVFVAQNQNSMRRVMHRIQHSVLLVSDPGRASLVKDVLIPYSHRITAYDGPVGVENRKTLLFFRGNRFQKRGGEIRDKLFEVLENEEDVIIKHGAFSKETQVAASHGMHLSKFCLHPAGSTPTSCRLFDAIVSMCIPVIVSDKIELPFEDVVDYRKIAIFVNSTSAVKPGFLVTMLRNVPTERILEFQKELKSVKRYFDYAEDSKGAVNEIWREVAQKLPLIKLMINRDKRLIKGELTEPDCSCVCSSKTATHQSSY